MSKADELIAQPPKVFFTDVFGTVVNWRKTVVEHLEDRARKALNSPTASIASAVRMATEDVSWPDFAQQWRNSYYQFTRGYDPDTMAFRTIDEHHLLSLQQLLYEHNIDGLWTHEEVREISRIWHKLTPWPDSPSGLRSLHKKFITSTLSNGNRDLLKDLATSGKLSYNHFVSAEDFKVYKPNSKVYVSAALSLQTRLSDCCLVAAHLSDLKAAKASGFKTVYIERHGEESYSPEEVERAKTEAFVDMWITINEQGFKTLAEKFDC